MENFQASLGAVGIYTALNFLILLMLGNKIGQIRRKYKIAIGDGDNVYLKRVMRGQANACENMPIFLIGLSIAALIGAPLIAIHALGLIFTLGRAIHAHHFMQEDAPFKTRIYGFGLALLASIVLFAGLIGHGLWSAL